MQRIAPTVWVAELATGVWLHTTTGLINGGYYYPANGLVVERTDGSLLIDTGYEGAQAEALLDWSKQKLKAPITKAVATHFHSDRTGGIYGLAHRGVPTFAHPLTYELATIHQSPEPKPLRDFRSETYALAPDVELFFPGAGHTWDNVTVWLPESRVLFGGCFLKSETSRDLGNLADADLSAWSISLERLSNRYTQRKFMIPGHGSIAGHPIARTRDLLQSAANAG